MLDRYIIIFTINSLKKKTEQVKINKFNISCMSYIVMYYLQTINYN